MKTRLKKLDKTTLIAPPLISKIQKEEVNLVNPYSTPSCK